MESLALTLFIFAIAWGVICFIAFFKGIGKNVEATAIVALFASDGLLFFAAAVTEFFYLTQFLVVFLSRTLPHLVGG